MSGAVHQPKPIARRQAKTARQPLLSSCAVAAALAAAGHGAPLWAQSYIANVASTTNATVRTGPGTTTVTVSGSTAIVNWTATNNPGTDGVVAFQNAGTNAFFESTGGNYQVLNRVLTSGGNPISFAGTTESVIGSIDGGPRGGTLWFYSPGGVILGPTARFDVGSLGLSTLDILDSDFLDGNTSFSLAGTADSRARVTLMPGAQINALNEGSYVAIVAPRIDQGGTVTVNGSAAYVAAEAADITINGGLFNIAVQSGSATNPGGETTLTHSGTTTGPSSNGGSDTHAIYMMAIPKNNAVTMLVSGTAGYDPAVSASVENGVVVLASGVNLTSASNGLGGANVSTTAGPAPTQNASITISDATINSRLTGIARTRAAILQGSGTTDFASSVSLKAGGTASVIVQNSGIVSVGGDLTLDATATGLSGTTTGGTARISLNSGSSLPVTMTCWSMPAPPAATT
jgi:filamentous hemagglutinin family protein